MQKIRVIKDTREKNGAWLFPETEQCAGTLVKTLKTGDYTLEGFEDVFVIERKRNTSEIAMNINQKRFENELIRLEAFQFPFLICEFTYDDIMRFPANSGIPKDKWGDLRVTGKFIQMKLSEYQIKYKTKIILAGAYGMHAAGSLFKRMIEWRSTQN